MHTAIAELEQAQIRSDIPAFRPGDTLKVHVRVKEGSRSRIQIFQGVVLRRQGGASYRLRTTDDARAVALARARNGIEVLGADEHGISLQATEEDVAALTVALGSDGVGILALTPELATLEDLFFRLTEDAVPREQENERSSDLVGAP